MLNNTNIKIHKMADMITGPRNISSVLSKCRKLKINKITR